LNVARLRLKTANSVTEAAAEFFDLCMPGMSPAITRREANILAYIAASSACAYRNSTAANV
jgi:hypothetical protein